jgi:pyruvate ferredoxin oxidoreductase gamma subunit
MKKLTEIRWHGRGGQGVKTACEFVAAMAIHAGKFSQGFPEYGPERSGAPMKGFTRISTEPVKQHCAVYSPDVVLVLDDTLIGPVDVCEGLGEGGVVIVNTTKSTENLEKSCKGAIWALDATKIALDEIGRPIPNMPMVGALAKVTGLIKLDAILKDVEREFSKKFDKKTLEGNLRAVEKAYSEVKKIN